MFQFRLGRIPVEVHGSHLLLSAVLALSFSQGDGPGWPSGALVAAWMATISISVLVHELGHALASLAFGYQPTIQLVGMGGLTHPNAKGPIPWHKDVMLTFAGPMAGLALGIGCRLAQPYVPHDGASYLLGGAFIANVGWAVLNLLPVSPLDGGRIASAVLIRIFGRVGFLLAQILALVVAGAAVLLGAYTRNPVLALLFGFYGVRAVTLIGAYLRGDAPATETHPAEIQLRQAAQHFVEGRLEQARLAAEAVLEQDIPAPLRGRAHHLLGWVAVKEAKGREALDHFAQATGQKVETHALAAAFSLIGDESRANGLWELAHKETRDETVLHEWAGSLIRAGRADEARRLRGVHLPSAYSCAERVAYLRGDFSLAARIGEERLLVDPRAEVAYDTACAHARAGDARSALRFLWRAKELGFTDADHARTDPDLESLHALPEFEAYLAALRASRGAKGA